jgi:hypothetical protein
MQASFTSDAAAPPSPPRRRPRTPVSGFGVIAAPRSVARRRAMFPGSISRWHASLRPPGAMRPSRARTAAGHPHRASSALPSKGSIDNAGNSRTRSNPPRSRRTPPTKFRGEPVQLLPSTQLYLAPLSVVKGWPLLRTHRPLVDLRRGVGSRCARRRRGRGG